MFQIPNNKLLINDRTKFYMIDIQTKGCFNNIDQFILIRQIGIGSFGKVELALHIETNRFYAIKIISRSSKQFKQKQMMLLQRQINIHSSIDHPHIIKLWQTIFDSENIYMIMQLAQNTSLFSYQNKKKVFTQIQAYKFFSQTLSAINYLHMNDIIHRDIKPENILLDKNFNVKLCDLGWAAQEVKQRRRTFCGTYQYMAPEMAFDNQYCYKIDVWALGILLFQLLHGFAPFKARQIDQLKRKMTTGVYQIDNKFTIQLKSLISSLLKFNPDQRPQLNQLKDHPWIKKMKTQILKQAFQIKAEMLLLDEKNATENHQLKQDKLNNSIKNHKRIDSTKKNMNKTNLSDLKNTQSISRKNLQTQQGQIIKCKKKCRTQGEQSLQKLQLQMFKQSHQKMLNLNLIKQKKFLQKQNNPLHTHKTKRSNLQNYQPFLSRQQPPISLNKMKKTTDKIIDLSTKIQKKNTRLKTYNFF